MARGKSVLEKMIAAMNKGGDAAKHAVLRTKDIEIFAKPTPKKSHALKKSPSPVNGGEKPGQRGGVKAGQ